MAKKFFYVCAGLFLLALTYHLGARSAAGQAGAQEVGAINESGGVFVSATGALYNSPSGDLVHYDYWGQLTGLTAVPVWVATGGLGTDDRVVVTRDGNVYDWSYSTKGTTRLGNLFGNAPTASQSATWGQVKSTYRR